MSRHFWFLILLLVVGFGLRALESSTKSLWVDELHTLEVASEPTTRGVMERLRPDFHGPLHFLFVHSVRSLDPAIMRILSALVGFVGLWPLLALVRQGGVGWLGVLAAAAAFAFSPFQIQYGAELRPYGWLTALTATAAWAAFSSRPRASIRLIAFTAAAALGLYTHYAMAVSIVGIGAARLVIRPPGAVPWSRLFLAGCAGVCLFLPWVMEMESWIFRDPSVMGRDEQREQADSTRSPIPWRQLPREAVGVGVRTYVPIIGRLGQPAATVCQFAGVLLLVLLLAAIVSNLARGPAKAPGDSTRAIWGVLLACAVMAGMILLGCFRAWGRVPVQYFAPASIGWPLLAALLVEGCARRGRGKPALIWFIALTATLGIAHTLGNPREDLARGVARVRHWAALEGSPVTSIMRQPPHYSQTRVFQVYGPDLPFLEPADIRPPSAGGPRRLVVLTRNEAPDRPDASHGAWRAVTAERRLIDQEVIDPGIVIWVFEG